MMWDFEIPAKCARKIACVLCMPLHASQAPIWTWLFFTTQVML